MNEDIVQRFTLVLVLIGGGAGFYFLLNRIILLRARLLNTAPARWPSFFPEKGKPVILYFTTPNCAPCRTIQRPALDRIQVQHSGALEVVEIDASTQTELASRWGVMSVPTTFILDQDGKPRHVNHGVATAEKLASQLGELIK
jgi:thiol-disulfide isomerase/thioredoxin